MIEMIPKSENHPMSEDKPIMRDPTLWERLMFKINKRWPESYVEARLEWADSLRTRRYNDDK